MIIKEIKEKPVEHFALFIILSIGAFLFFQFRYDDFLRRWIIFGLASAYILWSLLHHYQKGDLHISIIVEYLLFALFAVVMVTAALF